MPTVSADLDQLLDPVHSSQFHEEYIGRRPLLSIGRTADRFEHLLTLAEYHALVKALRADDTAFKHHPSLANKLNFGKNGDYIDMAAVTAGYAQGSTVFLDEAERRHPPLADFCNALMLSFLKYGQPLARCGPATVFLTPPASRALEPHSDPADLFILQLAGEKHWHLYGERPEPGPGGRHAGALPSPVTELTMRPGMLLYVPRGYVHCAHTSDRYSFAVTIGFVPLTWHRVAINILEHCVERFSDQRVLVGSHHLDGGRLNTAGLETLREWITIVVASGELKDAAGRRTHSLPPDSALSFETLNELHHVCSNTRLRARGALRVAQIADKVTLSRDASFISAPASAFSPAFHSLALMTDVFAVADMPIEADGGLKVTLAKRLVLEGLHEIVI